MLKLEVFALRASLSDSRGKFIVSTQLDCTLHATVHLFLMLYMSPALIIVYDMYYTSIGSFLLIIIITVSTFYSFYHPCCFLNRVFMKKLCFFINHCNPSFAYISLKEIYKALKAMRVYSHSYWLVIFCTTNSSRVLARERWQTFENS